MRGERLSRICVPSTLSSRDLCAQPALAWCRVCHQGLCAAHIEWHYRRHYGGALPREHPVERFVVAERDAGIYPGDERREFLVIDSQPATEMGWAEIYATASRARFRAEMLNGHLMRGGRVDWHKSQWRTQ